MSDIITPRTQPYRIDWSPTDDISEMNERLIQRCAEIDESLESLFDDIKILADNANTEVDTIIGDFVPYTGATTDIDLGTFSFTTLGNISATGLDVDLGTTNNVLFQSDAPTNGYQLKLQNDVIGGSHRAAIGFRADDGSGNIVNKWIVGNDPAGDGSTDNLFFTSNSGTRVTLTQAGLFGINVSPTVSLDVKGSNTANVKIGDWGGGNTYAAIGIAGSLASGDANFFSSTGDKNLYINRPTGLGIYFRENNSVDHLTILTGGNVGVGTAGPSALFSVAEKFLVTSSGVISEYNNTPTVGLGVPAIYGGGRSTAQTAAVASVATYTVGAADGSFLITTNVQVTTSTLHNFTVTVAYTDETNTARVQTLPLVQLAGTPITAITNTTGAGPYEGLPVLIRCKAATSITIATAGAGGFTTVVYNVEGAILQLG